MELAKRPQRTPATRTSPPVHTRPYRKVARALAEEQTRDSLLDAAEREFLEGRWERASLDAIAASAGVTKQTLLRHFGSKEGLAEQAGQRGYERVREQRWAAPSGDIAASVDNLLDHYEQWGERSLRIGAADGRHGEVIAEIARKARRLSSRGSVAPSRRTDRPVRRPLVVAVVSGPRSCASGDPRDAHPGHSQP